MQQHRASQDKTLFATVHYIITEQDSRLFSCFCDQCQSDGRQKQDYLVHGKMSKGVHVHGLKDGMPMSTTAFVIHVL